MTSPTKFYHVIQIILQMCSYDQILITLAFLREKLSQLQFYKDLTRKIAFFKGWSWFKFNNLGVALITNLKLYTRVAKGLKLKVRKFWWLILTFVEVTREKPSFSYPEQGEGYSQGKISGGSRNPRWSAFSILNVAVVLHQPLKIIVK